MADNARSRDDRPKFPHYDWVFRSDLSLGEATPGWRNARNNGHLMPYAPTTDLGTGARWCSRAWLRRTDTGVRGPGLYQQGATSRMAMWSRGIVTGGVIIVVPDDQVATAAKLAAQLVRHGNPKNRFTVTEWSMALMREPQRTRVAVALNRIDDLVRHRLLGNLDVGWIIHFAERTSGDRPHTHDYFRIETPDGKHSTWRLGLIHHDHEPVPARLVNIARATQGSAAATRTGSSQPAGIVVDHGSYRPFEPDETDNDATILGT